MPRTVNVPSRSYSPSTRSVETAIDNADNQVNVNRTRESWPDVASLMDVKIMYSPDNGSNWQLIGGATQHGGVLVNRFGTVVTEMNVRCSIPDAGQANRRVRGDFTNLATLNTAVTASVTTES